MAIKLFRGNYARDLLYFYSALLLLYVLSNNSFLPFSLEVNHSFLVW
jgi:hypothetical protein